MQAGPVSTVVRGEWQVLARATTDGGASANGSRGSMLTNLLLFLTPRGHEQLTKAMEIIVDILYNIPLD